MAHYGKKDQDEDDEGQTNGRNMETTTRGTTRQHPQPLLRATARRVETGSDGEGEGITNPARK